MKPTKKKNHKIKIVKIDLQDSKVLIIWRKLEQVSPISPKNRSFNLPESIEIMRWMEIVANHLHLKFSTFGG